MLDDFQRRQFSIMRDLAVGYSLSQVSLGRLIQGVEGASNFVDASDWEQFIFPILLRLETVYAVYERDKEVPSEQKDSVAADVKFLLAEVKRRLSRDLA